MRVILLTNIDIEKGLVNGSQGTIISFVKHDSAILPRPKNIYDGSSSLDGNDRRERVVNEEAELIGGSHAALQTEEVKRFMASDLNQYECWPRVKFDNGQIKTVVAHCAVEELGNDKPYSLLARTQIPLAAAWAMTIHKAQGMTLDKVIVDLSRAFEDGQVYVALSRARTPEGLKVLNLGQDCSNGGCNRQVKEFLKRTYPQLDID
ncbi:uncharacterized protein MYCFIDRAFT_210260 [Pseudocercospora fijiensis CIRAD86]|uniref:DNA replication helicase domain-containing protein n=1 Tax=Pseudocercospora fijiensis (strain CIRAD86) TaxID=383855 RepID=M2Z6Y0_PSEFD|nr:uncharacterized protein MYCFIDRAFT_210260 [Pseudocercospora fijiensis CIRAD86]EME85545.1 hypothetical protein MYCFIDRAFT_210260 [Pseudocercospora fijiensis CIRAD86]